MKGQSYFFFFLLILGFSCGKDELSIESNELSSGLSLYNTGPEITSLQDGARACRIFEEWITDSAKNRSLDILFMLDDSGSMTDNIRTMAYALNLFFPILEESGIHFCTGIMLGYANNVDKSGKFIQLDDGGIRVMCRDEYTVDEIVAKLYKTMLALPLSGSFGEAGLYSLKEAITTNLNENQSLSFFNTESAWPLYL